VINGRDPYSAEATYQIQQTMYGDLDALHRQNQQRFAYPLFAVLPAVPLGLISFSSAQQICLWGGIGLAVATVWLWCGSIGYRFGIVMCATVLAAPPISLGIILRQPTVLYLFLLALTAYFFKRERYFLAGIAGALASAKPQLAIFVLGPLAIYTLIDWKKRKGFIFSTALTIVTLCGLSFAWEPSWFSHWIATVKAYGNYGRFIEFYNWGLFLPIYLWLWKNRALMLDGPFLKEVLFLAPTAIVSAGYAIVALSCLLNPLEPWALYFFRRAGLLLAIEAIVISFTLRTANSLQLQNTSSPLLQCSPDPIDSDIKIC
jgi:hypothetical protein